VNRNPTDRADLSEEEEEVEVKDHREVKDPREIEVKVKVHIDVQTVGQALVTDPKPFHLSIFKLYQ